jgi:hypothetical protein
MKKILSKLIDLFSKKKYNTVENIKITSDIIRFTIGTQTLVSDPNPPFVIYRVNWFYLLNEPTERIRCLSEQEAVEVSEFLNNVLLIEARLGNRTICFNNVQSTDCVNNECQDEVANGIRQNNPNRQIPSKILPSDFGVNHITNYTLNFSIIGYIY